MSDAAPPVNRPALWRAAGGVVGPALFITSWAVLGAQREGYSPVNDPISRLAAAGAETRGPMTLGFVAFALGVGAFGLQLRDELGGNAGGAAIVTAVGAVAIAATPLDSGLGGTAHAAAAGLSYVSLAAVPLLAVRPLRAIGRRGAAAASLASATVIAATLGASVFVSPRTGLWQRIGLTVGDLWLMAAGITIAALGGMARRAKAQGTGLRD